MKSLFASLVLACGLASCYVVKREVREARPDQSAQAFEVLKSLAGGVWHGESVHDGKPFSVDVTYEIVSGGTVVMERMFPKSEHEMISMYHRDGARLLMTHYCGAGNQPRMQLVGYSAGPEPTLSFDYLDATNLGSPEGLVMHAMRLSVINKDEINTTWTAFVDGKLDHTGDFRFTRSSSAGH